jgi:hypothetical protein
MDTYIIINFENKENDINKSDEGKFKSNIAKNQSISPVWNYELNHKFSNNVTQLEIEV